MTRTPARLGAFTLIILLSEVLSNLGRVESAYGQAEPIYDQLVRVVKRDYLSLGVLLQTVADFQIERTMPGSNGFSIANFRIALSGDLDQRFGYFLQTNFAGTPSILDARMYYRFSPSVHMNVGQFKSPISYEFLTPASSIDFVNRAQAVTPLAPGRQIGLSVGFESTGRSVRFDAGAFNGNGTSPNGNDNDNLLYAARVSGTVSLRDRSGVATGTVEYGVNAGVQCR